MSYGTHTHTTQLRVSLGKNQEEYFLVFCFIQKGIVRIFLNFTF